MLNSANRLSDDASRPFLMIQEVLLIKDLETPMGTYPRCLLRGSDVLAIDFS